MLDDQDFDEIGQTTVLLLGRSFSRRFHLWFHPQHDNSSLSLVLSSHGNMLTYCNYMSIV